MSRRIYQPQVMIRVVAEQEQGIEARAGRSHGIQTRIDAAASTPKHFMDAMDEDEQLKRAIALSLEEATNPPRRRQSTPGSDDDDTEAQFQRDLQAAIEASKAAGLRDRDSRRMDASSTSSIAQTELQAASSTPAFPSERAQMERARLERLKRLRGENMDPILTNSVTPPTKRQRVSPPPQMTRTWDGSASQKTDAKLAAKNGKPAGNTGDSECGPLFWDGELRQIANRLVDRDKDVRPSFRLSEIIGPKFNITLAILSSYSNSVEWLYHFFDSKTPIVVVNQPGEDGNSGLKELAPNMLMTKPFLRNGRGCMHIKIMLLFYKDGRLRVVVPTANFVDYDWRDIENTAWVQDIPNRQSTVRHDPKATDFPATLQRVLHSLNVPAALTKFLDGNFPDLPIEALSELRMRWDWSRVKVKLVASLAGKHEGWDRVEQTGHPALMKAVQDLGAQPPQGKQVVLECQGSSIGTYSRQWMDEFYCSARGESARTWLDKPRSQRMKLPWPPIKILFPSVQTVKDSVLGMPGGGTMFCRKSQWESKNFPRELFHDSNSKRGRVLMHSKMIIGTFRDDAMSIGRRIGAHGVTSEGSSAVEEVEPKKKEKLMGWAYVGSHNFTPSAWGTLSGTVDNPSLNIVNYELGIVIPLRTYEEVDSVACWGRPARKYVEGVDRAWIQEEMRQGATENAVD